jgi:predicted secreted protein
LKPVSIVAVYLLFLTLSLFLVLPFGMRTDEEAGAVGAVGHAESSPHAFRFGRVLLRASILAAVLFAMFYANYVNGWVNVDMLDWAAPPANEI